MKVKVTGKGVLIKSDNIEDLKQINDYPQFGIQIYLDDKFFYQEIIPEDTDLEQSIIHLVKYSDQPGYTESYKSFSKIRKDLLEYIFNGNKTDMTITVEMKNRKPYYVLQAIYSNNEFIGTFSDLNEVFAWLDYHPDCYYIFITECSRRTKWKDKVLYDESGMIESPWVLVNVDEDGDVCPMYVSHNHEPLREAAFNSIEFHYNNPDRNVCEPYFLSYIINSVDQMTDKEFEWIRKKRKERKDLNG